MKVMKEIYQAPAIFEGIILYSDVIAASASIDDFTDKNVKFGEDSL